jgi:dienelactone hydrolase
MKMRNVLCCCVALLAAKPCVAQNRPVAAPLWGTLAPGPYAVGFRVLYRLDRSRVWEAGDSTTDMDPARPMRVSVWYPAKRNGSGQAMRYGDYVHLATPDRAFRRLNALLETRDTLSQGGAFVGAESFRPKLNSLPVPARAGAERAPGTFPLLMYSAGWNSSTQHDNSVLAEYLASHGYVVAAVPQVGPSASTFSLRLTPVDLEIQMRDIEFAMGVTRQIPGVDRRALGLIGWSMGGVISLLIEGRNSNVGAVVGLDASFRAASWVGLVTSSQYFLMRRLRAPLLALQSGHPQSVAGQSDAVVDSLHFAPRYLARVPDITHGDFSDFAMIAALYPVRIIDRTADQASRGHEWIVRTVKLFLDGTLKRDARALGSLRTDTSFARIQFIGPAVLPTEADFVETLRVSGLDRAVSEYRAFRAKYPTLTIIDYSILNGLAYQLLRDGKRDLAILAFTLDAEAWPSKADAFDSLADGYLAKADSVSARVAYERVLRVLPADSSISPVARAEYRARAEAFLAQGRKP